MINELPRRCYFRLGHWNNTGLEAQLGQRSDVPLRVVPSLFLPLVTHRQTQGQVQQTAHEVFVLVDLSSLPLYVLLPTIWPICFLF